MAPQLLKALKHHKTPWGASLGKLGLTQVQTGQLLYPHCTSVPKRNYIKKILLRPIPAGTPVRHFYPIFKNSEFVKKSVYRLIFGIPITLAALR